MKKSRRPKTVKGYLNMLIRICEDSAYDLKDATDEDVEFLASIRAGIQNELGEDVNGTMEKHNLKWDK